MPALSNHLHFDEGDEARDQPSDTKNLLVIDNTEAVLDARVSTLRRAGYAVSTARTAAEALRQIAKDSPDVILLDVRLPDADGIDLCARIKRKHSNIVVVLISGETRDKASSLRGYADGADLILREPVEPDELVASIGTMIRLGVAEAARRETEERYARLSAATLEGLVLHDHGTIIEANAKFGRLFGYTAAEVVGRSIADFIAPEKRSEVELNVASEVAPAYESVGRRKDGTTFPIELCGHTIEHHGRRLRVKTVRDLTERKQAEAALRASEALARERLTELEALYKDAPVGLALFSPDMRFVRINERLAEINGVPAADHIGRTLEEMVPSIADAAVKMFKHVFETGEPILGFELRGETAKAPGVERVWIEDYYPVKRADGAVAYVGAIVREVTEQVRAQEALRASEERFRVAQELSLDAFTIFRAVRNDRGRVIDFEWIYANPAAVQLLKRPADALIGRRLLDVLPGNRDKSDLFLRYIRVIETGDPHDIELHYDADGIAGWFRNMAVKLEDRVAIYFSDITERKKSEQRLTLLVREVDHRARNMLTIVNAILRLTKADSVEQFVSVASSRLAAFARVQLLLTESHWRGADLRRLLLDELAPYALKSERLKAEGPDILLPAQPAQLVALVLHELATNAVKYGALSAPQGRVTVEWAMGEQLSLRWRETGGPKVMPPDRQGFGTNLIARIIGQQLGGSIQFDWKEGGLHCELTIASDLLADDRTDPAE
jgi:PAS domain S-box-containing protein